MSESALFVTLTYDNEHVPISPNKFMTLQKTDVQKFFKRLRKIHGSQKSTRELKVSYYACGEYGGRFKRPHYHAIIFNSTEQLIKKAWTLGSVFIGTVTGASIGYTLKYINKGRYTANHSNDDRLPEFALMSKRMGTNYLTEASVSYHRRNVTRPYLTLEDGVKMAIPRYYKDKIWPITLSDKRIRENPSIIHHLEENERERKKQAAFIQQLQEEKLKQSPPTLSDREEHEAKRNAIEVFKQKHLKRQDL